ncbi:MAG: hypothetical protein FD152_2091 [Xanthobacteraceae bacterium]|nr:MAG: hypothetical protein FD152_2091 [Xanthobacteraceae bacterium]
MQGPVEVLARTDAGGLHRLDGVEHGARSDRKAGYPEGAGKMGDVLGQRMGHQAGLSSAAQSGDRVSEPAL